MTPGPKKRNANRRGGGENVQDTKKVSKSNFDPPRENRKDSSPLSTNDASSDSQDKKYNKRTVASNWSKYDEPTSDPHADIMRGKDFEVLSSYSGGCDSQLQLQDERDWDDAINDKAITLDLKDLVNVIKAIPFHKRINLPEEIFDDKQISRFISVAENWKTPNEAKKEISHVPEKALKEPEKMDPSLNMIESYETEEMIDVSAKTFTLEEGTENIIASLASCLSLKNVPEKTVDLNMKVENNASDVPDDLDFLLNLSAVSKNAKQEEKSSKQKQQTNVDDWLNSILDD